MSRRCAAAWLPAIALAAHATWSEAAPLPPIHNLAVIESVEVAFRVPSSIRAWHADHGERVAAAWGRVAAGG